MPEQTLPQGYAHPGGERLPMLAEAAMDDAQRAAAQGLINGPRKGVFGPFIPLLRTPALLERVGKVGEFLRFEGKLDARLRELVTCATARHVGNQFEWVMHAGLARKAGVAAATIEALRVGARPRDLQPDEELVLDFTRELLQSNGVSDPTYQAALQAFGEPGVVELTTLVGYFVLVCWVMNVARTPAASSPEAGIDAFPA